MDSPPVKVRYSDLPDSPIQRVAYEVPSDTIHTTPQRKPRRRNEVPNGLERKRQKTSRNTWSTCATSDGIIDSPSQSASPRGAAGHGDPRAEEWRSDELLPIQPEESESSMTDCGYPAFVHSVLSDDCEFYQLNQTIFVVNGWNTKTNEPSTLWYHMQRNSFDDSGILCLCPEGRDGSKCFHVRFMREYGVQHFPLDETITASDNTTFLFSRAEHWHADGVYINLFSVVSRLAHAGIKNRLVVEYVGDDTGSGTWKCHKDVNSQNCPHIAEARSSFQKQMGLDFETRISDATAQLDTESVACVNRPARCNRAISYHTLPPPIWAGIVADDESDPPPLMAILGPPRQLTLSKTSTCPCKEPRITFDIQRDKVIRRCQVYGLTEACSFEIEVQKCPSCEHGYIGPECTDSGLFNLNNHSLFTLTLLDDYTCSFSRSETPFASWVSSTACRYQNHRSSIPFIGEKAFRTAWFAYIRLVRFDNDMICPRCGLTPKVTIWDGVTLAFSKKNLLPTIWPPTRTDKQSEVKPAIKPSPSLQIFPDRALRKVIQKILIGPPLRLPELSEDEDCVNIPTRDDKEMMERIELVPQVVSRLSEDCLELGLLFRQCFSMTSLLITKTPPKQYQDLYVQMAAEENALQLLNETALLGIKCFLSNPIQKNLFHLVHSPALYNVAVREFAVLSAINNPTLAVFRWIYVRAYVVLKALSKYGAPMPNSSPIQSDDWMKSGACYAMPQIRRRPIYPNIPMDNRSDLGGTDLRGEACQKFYSMYGERRLTGGLMCVWCPHSVCYGFHCIPASEGRNDVFSAIYTRWERAPEVVVYDFACALQPYCMVREPEFFSKTLFVVDAFHAKGHTRCGRAAFLSNYFETNPALVAVNSSAAECGNSGILRIRKSVSYMAQERAVIYTRVFLCLWNRQRIQRLEKST